METWSGCAVVSWMCASGALVMGPRPWGSEGNALESKSMTVVMLKFKDLDKPTFGGRVVE